MARSSVSFSLVCLLLPSVVLTSSAVYRQIIVLLSFDDPAIPTTLSALQFELVAVDSGGCGEQKDEYGSLVEFVSDIMKTSGKVIGVVGPFCGQYPPSIDLLSKIVENFNVLHISGSLLHPMKTTNNPVSLISLAGEELLLLSVFRTMNHFGWQRIGLISSISQDRERLLEISDQHCKHCVQQHHIL